MSNCDVSAREATTPTEMPAPKRIRKEKTPLKGPRCQYYIAVKKRTCPQQVASGKQYCHQHNPDQLERVPCPLNPSHTVVKTQLENHLLRCNNRPQHGEWYQKDINWVEDKLTDMGECESDIDLICELVKKTGFSPLPKHYRHHAGLDARLNEVTNQKHPKQQASLIGALKHHGLLDSSCYYLEFGCGKAEFSKFVCDSIMLDFPEQPPMGFGLIDRGVNRLKTDGKIREVAPVKRDRIDIKDLDLMKFIASENHSQTVAISKHLCGVATDLTMRCLSQPGIPLKGVVVAMCCRHVCDYHQLFEQLRQFLADHGITNASQFKMLQKVVSWAVDGGDNDSDAHAELGLSARRLIDEARAHGIRAHFPDYTVELFEYAPRDITRENTALVLTKLS